MEMLRFSLVAFLVVCACNAVAKADEDDDEPLVDVPADQDQTEPPEEDDPSEARPGERKMTFKPPQLTEEEEKEVFLPKSMKCDGCQAVATQWDKTFAKAHLSRKKDYRLDEGQVFETMERACEPATYEVYGISTTDSGANRLKGPSVNANGYGVTQMGGMTPFRLSQTCKMYLGELEEWDVYKRWLSESKDPEVQEPLKKFLCLEETDHCAKDPWGDFGNVPEKDSFGSFIEKNEL